MHVKCSTLLKGHQLLFIDVLRMNYFTLFTFMQEAEINSVLSTTANLTVLVPSLQAIENMAEDEKAFWMSKSNIPTLLKYVNGLGG